MEQSNGGHAPLVTLPVPIVLPSSPRSASVARDLLRDALQDELSAESLEDLMLLSSELIANAIAVSGDHCVVSVTCPESGVVRVAVTDTSPNGLTTTVRVGDPLDEAGRGLQLVAAISWRWGVEARTPVGKTVWFDTRSAPVSGRAAATQKVHQPVDEDSSLVT